MLEGPLPKNGAISHPLKRVSIGDSHWANDDVGRPDTHLGTYVRSPFQTFVAQIENAQWSSHTRENDLEETFANGSLSFAKT